MLTLRIHSLYHAHLFLCREIGDRAAGQQRRVAQVVERRVGVCAVLRMRLLHLISISA